MRLKEKCLCMTMQKFLLQKNLNCFYSQDFFSGILNVLILLGFSVRFWLFVGFGVVVIWLDLFVWGFLFCFCLNITPLCTSKPQAAVAAGVRQILTPTRSARNIWILLKSKSAILKEVHTPWIGLWTFGYSHKLNQPLKLLWYVCGNYDGNCYKNLREYGP